MISITPIERPALVIDRRKEAQHPGPGVPSRAELILLWLVAAVCFVVVINHFQPYSAMVDTFGDNGAYISAATAIQHWDFRGVHTKQGWGLSYLIAFFSWFHLSPHLSLLLIRMASSMASVLLVQSLWGGWIAAFFAILSFDWLQVSLLGGAEPLFVLLILSSFWFSRKERWLPASLVAALATIVRPLGVFALLAIGLHLSLRRDFKKAFLCTAIAMVVAALYVLPFWLYFHDPLYQFHRYQQADWQSGFVIGWPFRAIALAFWHNREPRTNVIFTAGWLAFAVLGAWRMTGKGYRQYMLEHGNEYIFAVCYMMFLFCYNSVHWARAEFPRFVIPALPFLLLAFDHWLPKSRYVTYSLSVVSSALGACSAVGIRNVMGALR